MSKVIYEKRDEIAYITLNRPEVHNAIDTETDELLFEAWTRFRTDHEVRLAIITGAGDKAFCAGADLKSHVDPWLNAGPDLGRSLLDKGFAGRITRGLHRTSKPIIAALNGWVIGGGIELALACDIRIASEHVNFGFFHIRRGMHFADGGIVRLVNTCGVGIAMSGKTSTTHFGRGAAIGCTISPRPVQILLGPRRKNGTSLPSFIATCRKFSNGKSSWR